MKWNKQSVKKFMNCVFFLSFKDTVRKYKSIAKGKSIAEFEMGSSNEFFKRHLLYC